MNQALPHAGPNGATLVDRLVAGLVLIGLSLIGLAALVVVLVVAVPLTIGAVLAVAARRWVRGLRAPNGPLDGRRNVRVVIRDPDSSGA